MEFGCSLSLVPAEMLTLQVRDRQEPKRRQKLRKNQGMALCVTSGEWITSLLLISEDIFSSYLKH